MAKNEAVATQSAPATANLTEGTIVLSLELGRVSNRKKLRSDDESIQTEVDRTMLHISKDLFDAPELKACLRYLWGLKGRIKQLTIPSPHLRGGMYHVKLDAVETVDKWVEEARAEFTPMVQAFADVVDVRREESRERLGTAYNAADYPTAAQVLGAFSIKHSWLTLGTPSSLKKINKALFEREAKKAQESIKSAVEEITVLLTVEAKKLADHLIEKLQTSADGKKKIFRDSTVSNITEFLAAFKMRDIGSSEELNTQIERMRQLVEGVDPEELRQNDKMREDVAAGFSKVSQAFDKLIINKPSRMMSLHEEE